MRGVYTNLLLSCLQPISLFVQQGFWCLFLFLMIAHIFVFANIFLIFSVLNKIFFVDLFLYFQNWTWKNAAHPFCIFFAVSGKYSQTFRGFFIFASNKEQTTLLWELPFADKTVWNVEASLETSVNSSSEAISTASLVSVTKASQRTLPDFDQGRICQSFLRTLIITSIVWVAV